MTTDQQIEEIKRALLYLRVSIALNLLAAALFFVAMVWRWT